MPYWYGDWCSVCCVLYWLLTFDFRIFVQIFFANSARLNSIREILFLSIFGWHCFVYWIYGAGTLFAANSIEKLENFDEIVYVFVYASWLSTLLSFTISYILFISTLKSIQFHFQMCTSKPFESLWIFLFLVALFVADIVIFVTHISQSESDCRMKCHRQ